MPEKKKKLPAGSYKIWVSYMKDGKAQYVIATKANSREYYYLYKVDGDGYIKVAKAKSPLELEKHIK